MTNCTNYAAIFVKSDTVRNASMRYNEIKPKNNSTCIVNEVKMSPNRLMQFVGSEIGETMTAGFEAELLFNNHQWTEKTVIDEIPVKSDIWPSVVESIDDIEKFFNHSENNRANWDRNKYKKLLDIYYVHAAYNTAKTYVNDFIVENVENNEEISEEILVNLEPIVENGNFTESEKSDLLSLNDIGELIDFSEQHRKTFNKLIVEITKIVTSQLKDSLEEQLFPTIHENLISESTLIAKHDFNDGLVDSREVFIAHQSMSNVNDIHNELNGLELEWPKVEEIHRKPRYITETDLLELFVNETNGFGYDVVVKMKKPFDYTKWTITKDGSLSADYGYEFVSPAMPLTKAVEIMPRFFEWVKNHGGESTVKTGFHMSVSTKDFNIENFDYVKMALFLGDRYVLEQFDRLSNGFTIPALTRITVEGGTANNAIYYDKVVDMFDLIRQKSNSFAKKLVSQPTRIDKFTSIHPKEKFIEIRSAGNSHYIDDVPKLQSTLARYAYALSLAADSEAEKKEYAKKLYQFLSSMKFDKASYDITKLFAMYSAQIIDSSSLIDLVDRMRSERDTRKSQIPEPRRYKIHVKHPELNRAGLTHFSVFTAMPYQSLKGAVRDKLKDILQDKIADGNAIMDTVYNPKTKKKEPFDPRNRNHLPDNMIEVYMI